MNKKMRGFTVIEIIIVVAILAVISFFSFFTFADIKKNENLQVDASTITETLQTARAQTLSSQDASQYGVHFDSTGVTLFKGFSYSAGSSDNKVFKFSLPDVSTNIALSGGGSDVIFNRLSGETSQNGTVIISSPSQSRSKTVTIYKTGLVEVR